MAVALPFIMIGMSVLGAMSSANAAKKQAANESAAAEYNAGIADRNAGIARDQAAQDAEAQRRTNTQKLGSIRAGYGASGVTMEGSPLDVLQMSAYNAELDVQNIKYKGELRALGYEDTAGLDRMRASAAIEEGDDKAQGILIGGLAKAGGQAYGMMG